MTINHIPASGRNRDRFAAPEPIPTAELDHLRDQGTSLSAIEERLANGYPASSPTVALMLAVADVSALIAAARQAEPAQTGSICKCGLAMSYHAARFGQDHTYEPRYGQPEPAGLREALRRWNASHANTCRATILGPDASCTCGLSAALAAPPPSPEPLDVERLLRIEAAARRLDRAYGPRSVGMVWTATQEMIGAWRELQELFQSASTEPSAEP